MDYSNKILTPVYVLSKFDKKLLRTVFEIPEGVYTNKLRLVDFMIKSNRDDDEANRLSGVLPLISRISIYSNNTLIDTVQDFADWMSFVVKQTTNEAMENLYNPLDLSTYGHGLTDKRVFHFGKTQNIINIVPTHTAWIDLSRFMGFLKGTEILPTGKLPNLKVVVEYDKNYADNFVLQNATGQLPASQYEQFENCKLVCDKFDDAFAGPMEDRFEGVEYVSNELETLFMPQASTSFNARLKGFSGKMVEKMVIMKVPTQNQSPDNRGFNKASLALKAESVNVSLNGRSLTPFGKVSGYNKMLGMLVDSYGDFLLPVCGHYPAIYRDVSATQTIFQNANDYAGSVHTAGYIAVNLMDRCEDLQITIGKEAPAGNDGLTLAQDVMLKCYGRVRKVLNAGSSGVVVSYM